MASFGGGSGPGFGELVRDFVRRYGWRAYALPVLVVVTVVALLTTHRHAAPEPAADNDRAARPRPRHRRPRVRAPPVAPRTIPLKSDTGDRHRSQRRAAARRAAARAAYTKSGDGTFRVLNGHDQGRRHGPLYRYDIEVENGIKGIDLTQFANLVDRRRWPTRAAGPGTASPLQRVDSGTIDFHVTLTSSMTVRQLCGYDMPVETSCYARGQQRARARREPGRAQRLALGARGRRPTSATCTPTGST